MKVAPLSGRFMIVSMLGILISLMFLPQYSMTWAFTIGIISVAMFLAAMISVTKAPVEEELALDEGAVRMVKPNKGKLVFSLKRKKK